MVVVSYDVSTMTAAGRKRLRHVAKVCEDYGQRVQFSVFECLVDPGQFAILRSRLGKEYSPEEDSLRFYFLGDNWKNRVEHMGTKVPLDLGQGTLIV